MRVVALMDAAPLPVGRIVRDVVLKVLFVSNIDLGCVVDTCCISFVLGKAHVGVDVKDRLGSRRVIAINGQFLLAAASLRMANSRSVR